MEMQQGSSSSSSSGSIDGKIKAVKAKAYAKVDAMQRETYDSYRVPVMLSITAVSGATEEQRAPLDLVVVLHVREGCNVPKNWKELLVEAMDTIVAELDDKDRLAVIIPSNRPTWMPSGSFVYPQLVTSKTSLTIALESAESILYGRKDKDKMNRAGCIIVISNSNDNIDSLVSWRFRSVHAFGFRDAQNARTMHKISSSRNCSYAILDDEHGQITHSFFATISRITTSAVAAMPVEIKLMCEQKVVLRSIATPGVSYYISYNDKTAIMWPNAHLAAGMTTNIFVYLGGVIHPEDLPQLFTVQAKYGNELDKVDVQLVKKGSEGSRKVAAEIVRMEAVKIIAGITTEDKYDWKELHWALVYLLERWTILVNSNWGREAPVTGPISRLAGEMREMEARLYNNYYWLEYMLSWQSHQQCQLPLAQPFMQNQSTSDPLLQLRILAKAQGKITEHQQGIPVMVRVMASDAGLAMVRRASLDLVLVIDVNYGVKEKERKTQERLHLLTKAKEMEEEHNKAKNMLFKLEECLNLLIKVTKNTEERLAQLTKAKEMEELHNKVKNVVVELEQSLKPLIKAKEEENERMEMEGKITQKRQQMNSMSNEMNGQRCQCLELEKDVDKVMKNSTEEQLGLLIKVERMVVELEESVKLLIKAMEQKEIERMEMEEVIARRKRDMNRGKSAKFSLKHYSFLHLTPFPHGSQPQLHASMALPLEMNNMANEMNGLQYHAMELEKDVDKVKKNTEEWRGLLIKAKEMEEEHNNAKNMVVQLEESLKPLIKANEENENERMEMESKITQKRQEMNIMDNKINELQYQTMELKKDMYMVMKNIEEQLGLLIKAMEMEEEHNKAKNMVVELEESLELLIKAMEEKENERMEMEGEITHKSQEKNGMANIMNRLRNQAVELEKDLDKVTKNTKDRLDLLIKAKGEKENDRKEMGRKITRKRQEMDGLRNQARELEKDVDKVVKNTEQRLGLLTKAIEFVMDKLSIMDSLAIVHVQSSVTETASGLFEMSKQGRTHTLYKVQKLSMALTDNNAAQIFHDERPRYCKALQWTEQPKEAMRNIRNCIHSAPSSSSSPCSPRSAKSEGHDVGGSTSTLQKALMYAMKILDDRRGLKEDYLGSIIVISDNDDDSICMETLSPNYMVHAFGFYGTHSTRALYHIASSSNGIYNIINDDRNQITEAFTSCINKMTSTISVDTKVEIMCNPSSNVALSTIESAQFRYSIGNDRKSCSVLVGALSAGTVKNFIIYVDNVHEDDYDNLSKYITVRVKWMQAVNRMEELEGQLVVVRDGIEGYEEVVENIAHVEAVKIASDITDPNHSKMAMADMLQQMCIKCPDFQRSAGYERLKWLKSQMQKMEEDQRMEITDPNDYRNMLAEKLSYILSWLSYQRSYCWIKII